MATRSDYVVQEGGPHFREWSGPMPKRTVGAEYRGGWFPELIGVRGVVADHPNSLYRDRWVFFPHNRPGEYVEIPQTNVYYLLTKDP